MQADSAAGLPGKLPLVIRHRTVIVLLGTLAVLACTSGAAGPPIPPVLEPDGAEQARPRVGELRVMTLNLAHGRGESAHQILLDREEIIERLDRVAAVIRREAPDVVALQEADGASFWSGNFDHVAYLAEASGLQHHFSGIHAKAPAVAPDFGYGTALLSRTALLEPTSVPFPPSFPTFTKGYVRASITWPRDHVEGQLVEIVSVHLDFSRKSVRREQVAELVADLSGLDRPLVLLGDLNGEWAETQSPVVSLVEGLGLGAFEPEAQKVTYPARGTRLDWVLASPELTFRDHRVLPDPVSDHRAVLAVLAPSTLGRP